MTPEDRSDMKTVRGWLLGTVAGVCLIGGASAAISNAYSLAWFPWETRMKTQIIHASNSYITTQQAALREMRSGYENASTDGQRTALLNQMRGIADTIPDDIQPDIRAFLAGR